MAKNNNYFTLFFLILFFVHIKCEVFWYQPEQIHLAYGNTVQDIVVTWSTFNDTEESIVEYGIGGFTLSETGSATLFVDGGSAQHSQYIHRVTIKNLTPNERYGKQYKIIYDIL